MAYMPLNYRPALALLLTTAAIATVLPVDAAYAFGSLVDKNDFDFQPELSIRPNAGGATTKIFLPCYQEINGDGMMNPDEPAYIAVTLGVPGVCGQIHSKYIRLKPFGPYAAGTEVKAETDLDGFNTLAQIGSLAIPAHAIRAFKIDPAIGLKKGDFVYMDVGNIVDLRVGVGDIRLTPYNAYKAGSVVRVGDADINMPYTELNGGAVKSFYTPSIVYEFGKAWYINADQDAATKGVEEGDVRLTNTVPNLMGDILATIGNPGKVVDSIMLTPDVARPGQTVNVTITVKNPSSKIGSALVETKVDGIVVDARGSPTLVKDEVATLVLVITAPTEVGRHKVQAGDVTFFLDVEGAPVASAAFDAAASTAQIAVLEEKVAALEARMNDMLAVQTAAPAPASANSNVVANAPGIIPALAIVALALAAFAARRRA